MHRTYVVAFFEKKQKSQLIGLVFFGGVLERENLGKGRNVITMAKLQRAMFVS
jgi:hypothetical protein